MTSARRSISAVLTLHAEGLIAHPSIGSFDLCCRTANDAGYPVERIAVLDRPDASTRAVIEHRRDLFDRVEIVDYGDVGLSRNHAVHIAGGHYVAFFDADDLWGSAWLESAAAFRDALDENVQVVCHQEYRYWFTMDDFDHQSQTAAPGPCASSYLKIVDSAAADFDLSALVFANLYASQCCARRALFAQYPYAPVDRSHGFGVEDWAWNVQTLCDGVRHAVVPGTVCIVRHKNESLSQQNIREGLLPPLHLYSDRLRDQQKKQQKEHQE